ncbi:MAG: hypothetical protein Q4D89_05775 [Arachnia propionica]|uniref:hypothetical protein n=1 Tax=Arachnia propionica TaxID=1750 RepID=UPI0026F8A102|nr:hypothetical protein [Arachnia propionica]
MTLKDALTRATDACDLITTIEDIGDADRAAWASEAKRSMPRLRRIADDLGRPELAVVVAAFFDVPVKQLVLALADGFLIEELDEQNAMTWVVEQLRQRGPEWASTLVAAACDKKQAARFRTLLDALLDAHDLPLPDDPRYWTNWLPGPGKVLPGRRFWARLVRAATVRDAFTGWIPPGYFDELAGPVATLKTAEPVPDDVLPALVQVFTRGDRPAAQQYALGWIDLLGMRCELWQHRGVLCDALPLTPSKVAGAIVEVLLRPELDDDELTALACVGLVRKEKGIRRALLKALPRLAEPGEELRELVAVLATDGDTTTSELATRLLQDWGVATTPEALATGLWREPALTDPEPMPEFSDEALRLDTTRVADLLGDDVNTCGFFPLLIEWTPAVLVAHARDHGVDHVRELVRRHLTQEFDAFPLRAMLLAWADGSELKDATVAPGDENSGLSLLAARRIVEVLGWLGELPCLLSTPSHQGLRVSWEAFAARVGRFREVGQPLLATDVAVALARLDRAAAPADLSPFAHPIHGAEVLLDEVLGHWRDTDPKPVRVSFAPAMKDDITAQWHYRMVVDGDAPVTHPMLGLSDPWSLPHHGSTWTARVVGIQPRSGEPFTVPMRDEVAAVAQLLPQHQARQVMAAVHRMEQYGVGQAAWCHRMLGDVAHPFSEALTVLGLAWAGGAAPQDRDGIAELWLRAWDEGRLTAQDLVGAWHSVLWELPDQLGHTARHVVRAPLKVAEVLAVIADGGGLALVWPLLAVLAEEAAGAEKLPATAAALLEIVLRLLPHVQAAGVEALLPNVVALASRKGNSKALQVARRIQDSLR